MLPHCFKKGKTWYIWHSTHSFEQNHHVNRMHVVPILWGHISEAQNVLCILFKHFFSLSWYRLIVFSVVTFSWISSTTKMKLHKKKRRVAAAMEEVQQERKTRCLCKVKNKNWHGDIYLSLLSQKNLPDSSYLLNNLAWYSTTPVIKQIRAKLQTYTGRGDCSQWCSGSPRCVPFPPTESCSMVELKQMEIFELMHWQVIATEW